MYYKVRINTDNYRCARCSKQNWEPGTVNDYMLAINGWHTTEKNLREVIWRLEMFRGNTHLSSEYSNNNPDFYEGIDSTLFSESYGMSERYCRWLYRKINMIVYHDRLCEFDRRQWLTAYGWAQGYFSIDKKLEELKKYGYTRIYFSELYDIRQFNKNMTGCYMEIMKSTLTKDETEYIRKEYCRLVWGRKKP